MDADIRPDTPLTPRQIRAREWYAKNKAEVCARKRQQYASKPKPGRATSPKPSISAAFNRPSAKVIDAPDQDVIELMPSEPKPSPEAKARLAARRSIEDIRLARQLGLSVEELQ